MAFAGGFVERLNESLKQLRWIRLAAAIADLLGHLIHKHRCGAAIEPVHFIEEMSANVLGAFAGLQRETWAHNSLHDFRPAMADPRQGAVKIEHHMRGVRAGRKRGE